MLFVVAKIRSLLEKQSLTHEHLKQVFMAMDVDGNSSLDLQEFRRALGVMGITVTSRQLSETFQAFDGDMDGTVNYAEFCERVFPDEGRKSAAEKIHNIFSVGESSKKELNAAAQEPGGDAEERDAPAGDAGPGKEPAISVGEISRAARDASRKLQESRWTVADRFSMGAPQRLDVLEENLNRIATHLGVELVKHDWVKPTEVDVRVKQDARRRFKRASTAIGLSITSIGSI